MNERQVLLNFIAGLDLCDHMGDVCEGAWEALKQIGIVPDSGVDDGDDESPGLGEWLAVNHGATTLHGTSLLPDKDED